VAFSSAEIKQLAKFGNVIAFIVAMIAINFLSASLKNMAFESGAFTGSYWTDSIGAYLFWPHAITIFFEQRQIILLIIFFSRYIFIAGIFIALKRKYLNTKPCKLLPKNY